MLFLHILLNMFRNYIKILMVIKMSFKEQLSKLRKRNKINQSDLANMLGVKQYVISSWETGRSEPNLNQLTMLSDIFKVPTDYILDKTVIRADSTEDFENVVKIFEQERNDTFIQEVNELCGELTPDKKKKMLEIIKASLDLNK